MGGNALKQTQTRRYMKSEYEQLVADVLSLLRPLLPDVRLREVCAYEQKPSFGDLDLVVEDKEGVREVLHAFLTERNHEIVIDKPKREHKAAKFRPPTWSVSWNGDFQVDFLFQPTENYEFACFYYNNPDLGNFLGHVARACGFKLGHKGLMYRLYDGTNLYDTVMVSRDIKKVLTFLGYQADRIDKPFETPECIFAFAASSPFFSPMQFDLARASYKDRIRDAKRPMYQRFLAWMDAQSLPEPTPVDRAERFDVAKQLFSDFEVRLESSKARYARDLRVKSRFHGHRVKQLTGLEGKALGELMQSIREHFGSKEALAKAIDSMGDNALDALILSYHN